jgi:predicted MFS family arabinose efflux permease
MDENNIKENLKGETLKNRLISALKSKRVVLHLAFTLVGVVGGYMYYHFVGCNRGCSITSSPYLSMLWGGMMGFLLPGVFEKPKKN